MGARPTDRLRNIARYRADVWLARAHRAEWNASYVEECARLGVSPALYREPQSVIKRFWRHVDRAGGPDACWPWRLSMDSRGYGQFALTKTIRFRAHRVAYLIARGPIADGLLVCHRCDNQMCCNPAHLFLGSHLENAQDRERKGRGNHRRGVPQQTGT